MEKWNSLCNDIVATGDNLLAGLEVAEELHGLHSGYHFIFCWTFHEMSLTALVDIYLRRHSRSVDLVAAPLDDGMVLHHHHGAHGPVLLPAHAALQHGDMETEV